MCLERDFMTFGRNKRVKKYLHYSSVISLRETSPELMFTSLENYRNQQPTRSCFLDGRYIPIVLENVPEFRKEPIHADIELDVNLALLSSNIRGSSSIVEGMNIFRLVVTTPLVSHSALVWVDTRYKTVTLTDVRSDEVPDERVTLYLEKIDKVVHQLLKDFFHRLGYKHLVDIAYVTEEKSENCERFGFCNAYVIKQVVDYTYDRSFDPRDIAKFAGTIERKYAHLLDPNMKPEVEYIVGFGGLGLGLGLGVLGGVAIGAAASRPRYYPAYGYPAYGYGGYPAYGYGYGGYPGYGY